MVLSKSKNLVGLGHSLMNDRLGKGKGGDRKRANQGIKRRDLNGESYVTNSKREAPWVKMQSVTEQPALDEFLSTAELAKTDFTADKTNSFKIVRNDKRNLYLLSSAEEEAVVNRHKANADRLRVPRRPPWDQNTTAQELDRLERESLLEWRRGLADLQESNDLLMTPFERNLEVWRQLWRVIERSDVVVQIVDVRNPLLFRCQDLDKYVKEVDPKKTTLLLVNKADMMTLEQRQAWSRYFEEAGIHYKFFSAELAKQQNQAHSQNSDEATNINEDASESNHKEESDERTQILTSDELDRYFLDCAAGFVTDLDSRPRKTHIGLVGYPNVGKSSTINALIRGKKVSVSATPGKTKHFQTIHLSDSIILCDCPGLVFPNFATTKAELVCNGVLPIDQLREYTGPVDLVAQRIPQDFLEATYGIKIETLSADEGGLGTPTAQELCRAYAKARGFSTTGSSQPDESRAARYILKDYVKGRLLFCHPPPSEKIIDPSVINDTRGGRGTT